MSDSDDSSIVSIDAYKPHVVAETICLYCLKRTLSVYPLAARLVTHECSGCGKVGGIIKTGQELDLEEV